MLTQKYKRTKFACYAAYFTMASIFCVPPMLFVTLREMYGISYTLLGTLVLTNFCTQLTIDLIFTAFSKYFNVAKVVRTMPLITSAGMLFYAIVPSVFPQFAYGGLLIGTVIFSVSAGLSEVLLSPTIAAIPSQTPDKDMSRLHSLYAFGVVTMVTVSTLFLNIFGHQNWMYLMGFLAMLPIIPAVLFMTSPMPDMDSNGSTATASKPKGKFLAMALCVACIFFGSCAENGMGNWISGFMENALHIDKAVGDVLGVAMFAVLLGIARILHSKFGGKITVILLVGMCGAAVCYLTAGFCSNVIVVFAACILTGLFTAMLWPGALIMMEENVPGVGIAAYALMAAGGDLGASLSPQLMGIVVDEVAASSFAAQLSASTAMTADEIGMKAAMLVGSVFPILGIAAMLITMEYFRRQKNNA